MIKLRICNSYASRLKFACFVTLMTARAKVLLQAMFKEIAGKGEITQELNPASTLRTVLDELAQKYGKEFRSIVDSKTGQIENDTLVMVNGRSMRKTDVQIGDGDVIMISVPIGGG
jgi:MoaD family protein